MLQDVKRGDSSSDEQDGSLEAPQQSRPLISLSFGSSLSDLSSSTEEAHNVKNQATQDRVDKNQSYPDDELIFPDDNEYEFTQKIRSKVKEMDNIYEGMRYTGMNVEEAIQNLRENRNQNNVNSRQKLGDKSKISRKRSRRNSETSIGEDYASAHELVLAKQRQRDLANMKERYWNLVYGDPNRLESISYRGELSLFHYYFLLTQNGWRKFIDLIQNIMRSWQMNSFIIFCILVNTVLLALFDPVAREYEIPSDRNLLIDISENVFIAIFTSEAILKIFSFGFFYPRETAYFRDAWNIFDFILVILGLVALFSVQENSNLSALRAFRILRTFKGFKGSKSLSRMIQALLQSTTQLMYAIILLLLFFVVFGLCGVTLFQGSLTQFCVLDTSECTFVDFVITQEELENNCSDTSNFVDFSHLCSSSSESFGYSCPENYSCHRLPGEYRNSPVVSFDNFFVSCLTLFQILTLEGWANIMHDLMDATPVYYSLYFFLVLMLGPYFILNLFVIIMSCNYNELNDRLKFEDLMKRSEIESRRIFAEIAESARRTRNYKRTKAQEKQNLQEEISRVEMRLMWSYENSLHNGKKTVISEREYNRFKAKHPPKEYEKWKEDALPIIMKKERESRLKILKDQRLFKSLDSLTSDVNPAFSRMNSKVEILSEDINQPVNENSDSKPKVQFGLDAETKKNISTIFSTESRYTIVKNFIFNTQDVARSEPKTQSSEPIGLYFLPRSPINIENGNSSNGEYSTEDEAKKYNRKQLLEETQKLLARAHSLFSEEKSVNEVDNVTPVSSERKDNKGQKFNRQVTSALESLQSMLSDGGTEDKQTKPFGNWMSLRNITRKKQEVGGKDEQDEERVALGLLTDNTSIKIAYQIVTHIWFRRIVVVLICANVLLLCFFAFDQSLERKRRIITVNTAFTFIFLIEIILKIAAFGLTYYLQEPLNLLDVLIIFPAVVEVLLGTSQNTPSVFSNLRVFRLFQLFQLPQIKPYTQSLQKLFFTAGTTLRHVGPFFLVLLLFLLLFTISGQHLFGGRLLLSEYHTDSDATFLDRVHCIEIEKDNKIIAHCPERANYDNFLWSFVTTFQVLTLENWNEILESAVASPNIQTAYAIAYFIILVSLGVFIVLQLFLAVLIDNFNANHSDRTKLMRKAIMREQSLVSNRDPEQLDDSRNANHQGGEEIDLESGYPNRKKRKQSKKNLQDESTRSTSTLSDKDEENLEKLAKKMASRRRRDNQDYDPYDHPSFSAYSCCCLSPNNSFRKLCLTIITNKYVEIFIVLAIFVSCVALALPDDSHGVLITNIVLLVVFTVEAALKIISYGFFYNKGSYLRDPWNVLDFVIVVINYVDVILIILEVEDNDFVAVKLLRVLRVLRPLRVIRRFESLRIVVRTLFRAMVPCFWIGFICLVVYWVGAVICVGTFGGQLHACYVCENNICIRQATADIYSFNPNTSLPTYCYEYDGYTGDQWKEECGNPISLCEENWLNPGYGDMYVQRKNYPNRISFDDLPSAMLTLYEVSLLEGWPQVMYYTTDITLVGVDPSRNSSSWKSLFWVSFLFLINFLLMQIFIAVIIERFLLTNDKETGSAFMSPTQVRWVEARTHAAKSTPLQSSQISSLKYYRWATNPYFENFITAVVLLNTLTLILFVDKNNIIYETLDYIFATIYIVEALIKMRGFGIRGYFKDNRNKFDFFIVVSVVVDIILGIVLSFENDGDTATSLGADVVKNIEIFRVLRVLRLIHKIQGVHQIIGTLTTAIPSILNISLVMLLLLFMFTVLGVELFSDVYSVSEQENFDFLNNYTNFNNFGNSFLTLSRMATGEQWNGIMRDIQTKSPHGVWFSVTFMVLFHFLVLNLFVAVILSSFLLNYNRLKKDREVEKNIKQFSKVWTERAQIWSNKMRVQLRKEMGLAKSRSRASILSMGSRVMPSICSSSVSGLCTSSLSNEIKKEFKKKESIVKNLVSKMLQENYLPYTEFPHIIQNLSPPLGIKGLGLDGNLTEAEIMRLVSKVNIPVTKTQMIHYQQTLYALVDHALGSERIPNEVQQLLEYRMPQRFVDDYRSIKNKNAELSLNQLYATTRLQVVLRNFVNVIKVKRLQKQGYSEEEISKLVSDSKNKALAAKVFATWLQPGDQTKS